MMTSNYKSLKLIVPPLHPVSISRGKPRWLKGGWLAHVAPGTLGRNYDALAPSAAALKGTEDAYHRAFSAQLAALDPRKVHDELGENAVLLCFCDVGRMCHRRIVAEWIEASLNVEIPELGEDPDGNTEHMDDGSLRALHGPGTEAGMVHRAERGEAREKEMTARIAPRESTPRSTPAATAPPAPRRSVCNLARARLCPYNEGVRSHRRQ